MQIGILVQSSTSVTYPATSVSFTAVTAVVISTAAPVTAAVVAIAISHHPPW